MPLTAYSIPDEKELDVEQLIVQFRAIIFLAVAGLCSVQKLCWAT